MSVHYSATEMEDFETLEKGQRVEQDPQDPQAADVKVL